MKQEAIALYRGNVQRTGEYQAVGVPDFHGIAWQFQTGGPIDLTPVVADGIVLVSSTDRTLYALDASSGERRWHLQMSDFVDTPPYVADGVVYVGDGSIHALDLHTGQHLWTWSAYDLPSEEQLRELYADGYCDDEYTLAEMLGKAIDDEDDEAEVEGDNEEIERMGFGAPICYQNRLYVVSDSVVMALDLATRQPVWWQDMTARVSGSSLAIADDQIYLTACYSQNDDAVYGLDSTTGLVTSPSRLSTQGDEILNPSAFAIRDHVLYAIESWGISGLSVELKDAEDLAVGQDMVYVTTVPKQGEHREKPAVIAYDQESGQMIWQRSDLTADPSRIRFPTLANSVLYLILDGQICCALDAATGRERWHVHLKLIRKPQPWRR